jgi:hypothetical protein
MGNPALDQVTAKMLDVTGSPLSGLGSAPTITAPAIAKTGLAGFAQNFGDSAKMGLPGGIIGKAAPMLAAQGVMSGISGALASSGGRGNTSSEAVDNSYQGPYYNEPRSVIASPTRAELTNPAFSGERTWFDKSVPGVFNAQGQMTQPGSNTPAGTPIMMPVLNPKAKKGEPMYTFAPQPWKGNNYAQPTGYADGGPVRMGAGSFIMPARETAEFGNGSTNAGQRVLSGLGGIPIRGAGDGTSDDIPASISYADGGPVHMGAGSFVQEARVADGEVHFPPEAVRRIGRGSEKRGTEKLYAMMKRAEQSRKQAARGGNGLNVAKGLRAA